jgi:hypothetical protein
MKKKLTKAENAELYIDFLDTLAKAQHSLTVPEIMKAVSITRQKAQEWGRRSVQDKLVQCKDAPIESREDLAYLITDRGIEHVRAAKEIIKNQVKVRRIASRKTFDAVSKGIEECRQGKIVKNAIDLGEG